MVGRGPPWIGSADQAAAASARLPVVSHERLHAERQQSRGRFGLMVAILFAAHGASGARCRRRRSRRHRRAGLPSAPALDRSHFQPRGHAAAAAPPPPPATLLLQAIGQSQRPSPPFMGEGAVGAARVPPARTFTSDHFPRAAPAPDLLIKRGEVLRRPIGAQRGGPLLSHWALRAGRGPLRGRALSPRPRRRAALSFRSELRGRDSSGKLLLGRLVNVAADFRPLVSNDSYSRRVAGCSPRGFVCFALISLPPPPRCDGHSTSVPGLLTWRCPLRVLFFRNFVCCSRVLDLFFFRP